MKKITIFIINLFILSAWFSLQAQQSVKIIVNQSVPDNRLSKDDIEKIYLGKKQAWSDGSKIAPVTLKECQAHETFITQYVKRSPVQFNAFWLRAIYTGTGVPPVSFENESDLIHYVSSTPGAIGYVPEETESGELKVIQIIR